MCQGSQVARLWARLTCLFAPSVASPGLEPSKLYSHLVTCLVGLSRRPQSVRMRRLHPTPPALDTTTLQTHHLKTPYCNSCLPDMSSRCCIEDSLRQSR